MMLYTEGHREDQYIIRLCYPLEIKIVIIIIIINAKAIFVQSTSMQRFLKTI